MYNNDYCSNSNMGCMYVICVNLVKKCFTSTLCNKKGVKKIMKQRIIEILENKNMIYKEMKDGNIILLTSNRLVSIEFFNEEYAKVYEDTEDFTAILLDPITVSFDLGYILGVLAANITNGKR